MENGEFPQNPIEWWSGIYNKTNKFEDGKNCLKARLEKLSIAHEEKTKKKETKREKYQLEKNLAEEPKIETYRLKMWSKFIRKDWKDSNKQGYMKSKAIRAWNKKIERKTPTLVKVLGEIWRWDRQIKFNNLHEIFLSKKLAQKSVP